MADITMCCNVGCPNAKHCYRVQNTPNPFRQSYSIIHYTISTRGVECEHYLPMYQTKVTDNTGEIDEQSV